MPENQPLARRVINKAAVYIGLLFVLLLLPLFVTSPFYLHMLIVVCIWIIGASSLRLIYLSGQISFAHAGFMSIGAYFSGLTAKLLGISPWLSLPLGGLVAMGIAFGVGVPFSRARGIYFTMVSLFFGVAVLAVNQAFPKYTGGYSGTGDIPPLFLGSSKVPYYYFFLILTAVSLLIMYRLEFSRLGRIWKAISQSYPVASSVGIDEAGYRVLAFAIGSFFVGLTGAAYAHYFLALSIPTFSFLTSINLAVYMLVGGINYFSGPIIGATILVVIPIIFTGLKIYAPYVYAGVLLIVLFRMPRGLAGVPDQIRSWISRKPPKMGS